MDIDPHHLRAIILKIQDYLNKDDRRRLHFYLSPNIPTRIRDDPSLGGTLDAMEILFDKDIINEHDFTFLINAFDKVQCFNAVKLLREHMREMEANGENQSIQSLTAILLQDQDSDDAKENDTNVMIRHTNPTVIVSNQQSPQVHQRYSLNKAKLILLIVFLLIIGFIMASITLIIKIQPVMPKIDNPNLPTDIQWDEYGIIIAGGNGGGSRVYQFREPQGMDMDNKQTIYVADTANNRIIQWKKGAIEGEILAREPNDQLNMPHNVLIDEKTDSLIISDSGNQRVVRWPRQNDAHAETILTNVDCYGLAKDHQDYLYVSDFDRQEVRRWRIGERRRVLVAGGHGPGKRSDQFNGPYHIFVDRNQSIYVSDFGNNRVMKWFKDAKEGILVAGGQDDGNSSKQLSHPGGIFVDQSETIYIVDSGNHRIVRWFKDAKEGEVVAGGHGKGTSMNQLNDPLDILFDRDNQLYVLDTGNNRIQKFPINKFN